MSTKARHIGNLFEHIDRDGDCWLWTGRTRRGYGVHTGGRMAYKVMYELLVGDVPKGLHLDHLCNTPLCVFPDHLEPVTHQENIRRAVERREHCKRGLHRMTVANTYHKPGGRRTCRACAKDGRDRYYAERDQRPVTGPTETAIRTWALKQGLKCKPVGRVPAAVRSAYVNAHQEVAA